MASLTGVKDLDKALKELAGSKVKKIARSAISKGMRVLAKAIKQQIPPKYKSAKKAIGSRFSKAKGGESKGQVQAKVGAAVGMPKFRKKKGAWEKNKQHVASKHSGSGVGISAANIHWAILGTSERKTGSRTRKTRKGVLKSKPTGNPVRSTGRMPAILAGIVKRGIAAGESAAITSILDRLRKGIQEANR